MYIQLMFAQQSKEIKGREGKIKAREGDQHQSLSAVVVGKTAIPALVCPATPTRTTRTTIQSTTPQSLRLMDALYTTDKDEFQTEMYILSA